MCTQKQRSYFYVLYIRYRNFSWKLNYIYLNQRLRWSRGSVLAFGTQVRGFIFTMFLDHTQRRTTVGRTPLNQWSVRRRDLYLTTHNSHNRQTSMLPDVLRIFLFTLKNPTVSAGFEPANLGTKGQHATSRPPKPLENANMANRRITVLGTGGSPVQERRLQLSTGTQFL